MLAKQTKNIISGVLKASTHLRTIYPLSLQSLNGSLSLSLNSQGSIPKFTFSTSENDNSDKDSTKKSEEVANEEGKQKTRSKRGRKPKVLNTANKESETSTNSQKSDKVEEKKLKSVPIRPIKLPLDKDEENQKLETYVLFSSSTPIIPFSQQPGFVKTGNLAANHISNKLAFFIQNELGEIYTVGLILENNVNKTLKKNFTQGNSTAQPNILEDKNRHKANITTKTKNYKVKLVEIEFKDNCIFAKGYPYKDAKLTPEEKEVNVQNVLIQMKNIILSIRQSVSHEKIEVFNNISFDQIYSKKFDNEKLDEFLCQILADMNKLSGYTKESLQHFIQAFLEQRSIIARMFMLKKKLEEVKGVLDIVNKSIQYADEQIWKYHEQAKARLSLDYIRSNYFSGEAQGQAKAGQGAGQGQSNAAAAMTGPAKKFMEKLPLIKDEVSREKVRKEIERLSMQDKTSGEYHKIYAYLDEVFSIPWDKMSEEIWDLEYSKKVLEQQLYGLDKVKERITEMIAVNKLRRANNSAAPEKKKGFVILLNGPPGTGKTTIAKAIATALKRESRFISFAGVTDPSFVKGHKRTYLDAQPGVFVKELIKAKVMNPVFILDEVDKLSKHFQGVDPYYALMEILNPEENHNFTDHYLDIRVDFSNVIFILTSNQVLNMLEPLRNRLEIIEVPAYIEQEKLTIAKKYLIPSVLQEHGLPPDSIIFDDETITRIVKGWCYYESGVRELRRCFEKIARKHAREILDIHAEKLPSLKTEQEVTPEVPQDKPIQQEIPSQHVEQQIATAGNLGDTQQLVADQQNIDFGAKASAENESQTANKETQQSNENAKPISAAENPELKQLLEIRNSTKLVFDASKDPEDEQLKKYLGMPVFDDMYERKHKKPFVGTANVLTVSGFVGHVLSVECVYDLTNTEKKGQLTSSGNLQKVLQESLNIARINALRFLSPEKIKEISEKNIHVHFLQGATPKDGPSAGISITTAFLSLALNKPIPSDISMTGEISLNGEVCKIGGVQAKVTASKALDIKRIILPWGNKTDFFELPKMLKEGLTVYFVKEYKDVYNIVFGEDPKALDSIEKFVDGKFIQPIQPKEEIPISHSL